MQTEVDLSTLRVASELALTKQPWDVVSVAVKNGPPTKLALNYVCLLSLFYSASSAPAKAEPVRRSKRLRNAG
jgi:hypothetical protein